MSFTVEFRDRNGYTLPIADGLSWKVGAYSARAIGGCEEASISVTGDSTMMWGLLDWLRYPVIIRNENNNDVWWGYVAAVTVNLGGMAVGVDVETVRNRVCVAYTTRAPDCSQSRHTTPWAEDAASQSLYGIHEERLSMGDITEDVALARRDAYLAMRKTPARTVDLGGGPVGATLRCAGWWTHLAWCYWEQPAGMVQYAGAGKQEHVISFSLTSTEFGFRTPSVIVDILGRFAALSPGMKIGVYGSASNDYVYTISSVPKSPEEDAIAYTSDLIWFDPADDIFDVNNGLDQFKSGDLIKVTGSNDNNGYYKINTQGTDRMEVNPKSITHEDVGQDVTIRRGHNIHIVESLNAGANPGGNVLIWSIGTKIAQSFTLPTAGNWIAYEVTVKARRIGAPGDSLRIGIYSNSAGAPSGLLASGTVTGSSLTEDSLSVSVFLASPLTLVYGTTYWLVVERTGSADPEHMFAVAIDEGLGDPGAMRIWKTDHWDARDPDCDMPFEVWARRETTLQIQDMVGSVLPQSAVDSPSGVYSRQWRDGEQTVQVEVEELLASGTNTGRRLLATVSPQKVVRIYPEPSADTLSPILGIDGKLRMAMGSLDEGQLPAGQWVQLEEEAKGLGPLFIERAQYTPGTGYTVLEPRSSAPWETWA